MSGEREKKGFLRAGELARAAGVSTDTLRHYERRGVLARPRRSPNGYREYPPEALERVLLVRRALAVGFTLAEVARVLRVRDDGGAPCREVRALAAEKLASVEEQLRGLLALRDELRSALGRWDALIAATKDGTRAGLLETLAGTAAATGRPRLARRGSQNRERMAKDDDEQ